MGKNKLIGPFIKWVGGKRQLINSISELMPKGINKCKYVEPFIGGGALFFHLQLKSAVINDYNHDLINVYEVIRDNLDELIKDLQKHKNEAEYFYQLRLLDRSEDFDKLSKIHKASRFIFLNKTCFNGLYRVNNSGEFNSPFGRYKNPNIVNEPTLKAVSKYLNKNDIVITSGDYCTVLDDLDKKAFVYLDPPYHPISETSNFTGYTQGGWNEVEQVRLKEACDKLTGKGINFMQSNSASAFIIDLYKDYKINIVKANRSLNSDATKRGEVDEVIIRNYE